MAKFTSGSKLKALAVLGLLLVPYWASASDVVGQEPTLTVRPAPAAHFDEVFFRSKDVDGTEYAVVRPPYREVVSAVRDLSKKDLERVDRKTTADFRGDNALSAVPRILVSSEYDGILKRGVDQRGRALRAFLEDYYRNGGHPSFVTSGRMNQVVLDAIVSRSLELQYRNKIDPKSISALYGPDIVRDAHGEFRVVEDNTGFIGGMGDLEMALKSLNRNVKGLDGLAERAPLDFYLKLVERYRSRAVPSGGRLVVVQMPPYADFEDRRFMSLMKRIGVDFVTPYTKGKLEFDSSGAWYRPDIKAPRERVGFLYLNGEHCWLDMKNPLTEPVAITEYAKIVAENLESRVGTRSKKRGRAKKSRTDFFLCWPNATAKRVFQT